MIATKEALVHEKDLIVAMALRIVRVALAKQTCSP